MRALIVHNRYLQPGGEDQVFEAEARLLGDHGHQVTVAETDNRLVADMSRFASARATVWSAAAYRWIGELIRRERPDIVHFHNTFPLISPGAYHAASAAGVPVVQTLHNYRLLCPAATLFRDGRPCEECVGKTLAWPAVRHACYRESRLASGVVAAMLGTHRLLGTWTRKVDAYIALTSFARDKFVGAGLPEERIFIKPNFVAPDPGEGSGAGGFALFVGRLTEEKGVRVLLDAWRLVGRSMPLRIAGAGPLEQEVAGAAASIEGVEFLGRQPHPRVLELMREASLVVVPSIWYEGFPMTVVEAWACGTPVVASQLGSLAAIGKEGGDKLGFPAGDSAQLARRVLWARSHQAELGVMRRRARRAYETGYTPERNYERLMEIYGRVSKGCREAVQPFRGAASAQPADTAAR